MIIGVLANALSAILGRDINRGGKITPYLVTLISMGVGSTILLLVGILTQGLPLLSMKNILYLIWLAIVNTALAFTIWNFTLRTLTAMESSVINGTMLVQIAVLAFFFLGESISFREGIGLFLAGTGAVIVQLKFKERNMQNGSFLTRRQ
jgi:drug/metabolite transporter (DMT)-like permease